MKKKLLLAYLVISILPLKAVWADDAATLLSKADKAYGRMQFDKACDLYKAYLENDDTNAKTHQRYGACLAAQGHYKSAVVEENKALKIDPQHPHLNLK